MKIILVLSLLLSNRHPQRMSGFYVQLFLTGGNRVNHYMVENQIEVSLSRVMQWEKLIKPRVGHNFRMAGLIHR